MDDERPKSSLELAMERLRKKDAESGVSAPVALTDQQKAEIAEVRRVYQAKLAHAEVMHQSTLAGGAAGIDPSVREALDGEYRRDRERLTSERESKIERIRQAK